VVESIAIFALGLFAWTFAEYVIHGWLGHTLHGVAAALHQVHHRDPHAVFTIGAWLPLAALWTIALVIFGRCPGTILLTGLISGFALYEALHYRIHFRRPLNACERYLRARHLLHHQGAAEKYLGVTSPLWDLIFGTEPSAKRAPRPVTPLTGRTNLRLLLSFHYLHGGSASLTTSQKRPPAAFRYRDSYGYPDK